MTDAYQFRRYAEVELSLDVNQLPVGLVWNFRQDNVIALRIGDDLADGQQARDISLSFSQQFQRPEVNLMTRQFALLD